MQNGANGIGPVVGLVMGSSSDWDVMKNAADMLERFGVNFEAKVVCHQPLSFVRFINLVAEHAGTKRPAKNL